MAIRLLQPHERQPLVSGTGTRADVIAVRSEGLHSGATSGIIRVGHCSAQLGALKPVAETQNHHGTV